MNAIKNFIVLAALAVVCYGVYHSITTGPSAEAPPEVSPDWDTGDLAELGPSEGDAIANVGSSDAYLADASANDGASYDGQGTGAFPGVTPVELPDATPTNSSNAMMAAPMQDPNAGADASSAAPWYGEAVAPDNAAQSNSDAANYSAPGVDAMVNPAATPADAADGWAPEAASPGDSVAPSDMSTSPGATNPNATDAANPGPELNLPSIMQSAQQLREAGRNPESLKMLSAYYGAEGIPPEQHQELANMLDLIAGEVIYSREHTLEAPYFAKGGETLPQVAEVYGVPWELLAKINGFVEEPGWNPIDPGPLAQGEELKVVRGPFAAVMDVNNRELILFLNDMYAGRFPVQSIGPAVPTQELVVQDKNPQPVFYPPAAGVVADSPNNPLGSRWIGLGGELGLHGGQTAELPSSASVRLSDDNIKEVFDILSVGSRIVIRK